MRNKRNDRNRCLKVIAAAVAAAICILGGRAQVQAAAPPQTGARAWALMEADTGRVLAAHNEQERLPMASTTKIMTALLAVENGAMEETVRVDPQAVGVEGSSIYLREGETLTLRELVYGLMMASGNDAAVAIAIHLGDSIEGFAAQMNARAARMGAADTHFVNPNGLPNDDHYTTAHDLALIACCAMRDPRFREVVATRSLDLAEDDDSPARYLRNKNRILTEYEGGNGVKTGYTKKAGKCLVAAAERDGMQLVAVVLDDPDMFADCEALLDYGFSGYSRQAAASRGGFVARAGIEGGGTVDLVAAEDIFLPLAAGEGTMVEKKLILPVVIKAPFAQGRRAGTLQFWLRGELLAQTDLLTARGIPGRSYRRSLSRAIGGWLDAPGRRVYAHRQIHGAGGGRLAPQV